MNNTFEFQRFKHVVVKDLRSIKPLFGLTILICALIPMTFWLLFVVLGNRGLDSIVPEIRLGEILCMAVLTTILTPSRMYRTCNLPKEGIYFAMLPASKLEKFLSMLLICLIVCPIIALFCGFAVDTILTLLPFGPYKQWIWEQGHWLNDAFTVNNIYNDYGSAYVLEKLSSPIYWILSFFSYIALFMFTTTIFKKHKVLKTILWVWLISFALELIFAPILTSFMTNHSELFEAWIETKSIYGIVNWAFYGTLIYNIIFTIVFLWGTHFRLKRMKY